MGYRSDVVIALTDSATRLIKTVIEHLPEGHEVHQLLKEDLGSFKDITPNNIANQLFDCDSKIHFDHVKWYEDYEDVSFFDEILESLDDQEWLFTRLGEESDDTEQRGNYWDSGVYIRRAIEW